jgi:hypothetical protein
LVIGAARGTVCLCGTSGKKGNVFAKQHGDNINEPANSKDTEGYNPQKPDNHSAPQYTVDSLNEGIKKNSEDEVNQPTQFVNRRFCHKKLLKKV